MAEGLSEERFVVIGAGVMGHGIAQVAAMAGYDAVLTDMNEEALDRGLAHVRANLDKGVDRGKVTAEARDAALANLSGSTSLEDVVGDASVVIEAVPENLELKCSIFETLGDGFAPGLQYLQYRFVDPNSQHHENNREVEDLD